MGMYDSFYSETVHKCHEGHLLEGYGKRTEYQTKCLDNLLDQYKIGSKIGNNDLDLIFAKILCYAWCKDCRKSILRHAIIVRNVFVGMSKEYWVETWIDGEVIKEGPYYDAQVAE